MLPYSRSIAEGSIDGKSGFSPPNQCFQVADIWCQVSGFFDPLLVWTEADVARYIQCKMRSQPTQAGFWRRISRCLQFGRDEEYEENLPFTSKGFLCRYTTQAAKTDSCI
jgi:hypothetical protein